VLLGLLGVLGEHAAVVEKQLLITHLDIDGTQAAEISVQPPVPIAPLPVLLDPYSGPSMQKVTAEQGWWSFISQWFAEQGFAVLVTDGRGTPGRGPAWEREIYGDIFGPVLEDQVSALAAVARHRPELDLGHPDQHPDRYDACSLLLEAPQLTRPLLLIHGLADDNVFPANTLRLSSALLAAGRPHEVLLLPDVTHNPRDETTTENLLLHEARFLQRNLGMA
jgi:dipeptidyl-peptidase-4